MLTAAASWVYQCSACETPASEDGVFPKKPDRELLTITRRGKSELRVRSMNPIMTIQTIATNAIDRKKHMICVPDTKRDPKSNRFTANE